MKPNLPTYCKPGCNGCRFVAKKSDGVKLLRESDEIDTILEKMDVADLWGIGRKYAAFLKGHNINNALQLKNKNDGICTQILNSSRIAACL